MTDLPLKNKTILFISPKFFDYEKEILHEMETMGATVCFCSHIPSQRRWAKCLFRLAPNVAWRWADFFFLRWLRNNGKGSFDLILVIKGEGLSPRFTRNLRTMYPNAHMVLYLWDSIANCRYVERKWSYFDEVFSFDSVDCSRKTRLKYRPLFFLNDHLNGSNTSSGNGLFFLGTLNGDRPKVIANFIESLGEDIGFEYWLFVRSKIELVLRKCSDSFLRKLDRSHFIFKPMPSHAATKRLHDCTAVLDIEHPHQNGLTMRTFGVIASNKKLITTNKTIQNDDFFDPSRICIIDRTEPKMPLDFLTTPFRPLDQSFVAKYSLRGWILEVLGIEKTIS